MKRKTKTIEVVPNPYIALDKDGVPQGTVGAGMPGVFVGAAIDLHASRETGKNRFYYPPNKDGSFAKTVLFSAEIVASVLAGELIVTNLADALACGLTTKSFLEPEKALAAEKDKALAYWRSVAGKDAVLGEIPRAPSKDPNGPPPPEQNEVEVTPGVTLKKTHEEG